MLKINKWEEEREEKTTSHLIIIIIRTAERKSRVNLVIHYEFTT